MTGDSAATNRERYDVVVVGAGNAALCAAIAAHERGARTLVLEKANEGERGGNTFFTGGGFRFPYRGLDDIRGLIPDLTDEEARGIDVGSYTEADMRGDLMRVTESLADPDLVDQLVGRGYDTVRWMRDAAGIRWVLMYGRQAFRVEGILKFWGGMIVEAVGAGHGLSEALFESAKAQGIEVRYGTKAQDLVLDERAAIRGIRVRTDDGYEEIATTSVVLASGGFEANTEMRTRYLGAGWEFAKVRGTRHNTGDGIRMALDAGAQSYGHWSSSHAVAWDLNAPQTGNRIVGDLYQKHSYPLGIIVNINGDRFVDEGADFRNYTYAQLRPRDPEAALPRRVPALRPADRLAAPRRVPHQGDHEGRRRTPSASWPTPSASTAPASSARSRHTTPPAARAASTRPRATVSRPSASTRRSRTGRCRSRSRRSSAWP